jgi:hypothetical protein
MCLLQRVKTSNGTVSFNVLGLVLLLILRGLIILGSFVLEYLVAAFQKRFKKANSRDSTGF